MPEHDRSIVAPLDRAALEALLQTEGLLFSEALGIKLEDLDPSELFKWFVASLLFGARIRESAAVRTYRELETRGLLRPETLRNANFGEMIDVMASGGYSRYDGITTRKLQGAAAKLLDEYAGDLNRLHDAAADTAELIAKLKEFWGVGDTTAGIFLRELRGLWPKANPPLGDLALLAARHLDMADVMGFWQANRIPGYDLRHFEAALTRIGRDYCRHHRCAQSPLAHSERTSHSASLQRDVRKIPTADAGRRIPQESR